MMCLNNKQGTETLLEYCAGTLELERAAAVENHARECAACRTLIAEQKQLWNALDEMDAPEVSADFDVRLYARIASEEAPSVGRAWWNRISLNGFMPGGSRWIPVIAGVAAMVVLAVGLSLTNTSLLHPHRAPDVSRQMRPDSVDVEQLEVTLQDLEMLTPPSASAENGSSSAGKSGKM